MKRDLLQGLLLIVTLGVLIAGAIACWGDPAAPSLDCPVHDSGNPWCQK